MTKNVSVPEGYKKTELGAIPEEWEVIKIDHFCDVKTGGTPSTKNKDYWDGDILWMSSGEINKKFVYNTEKKITQKGLENSNARILPADSVMMALNGQGKTRGSVAVLKIPSTCNQSLACMIPNEKITHYLYLFYNLQSRYSEIRNYTGDTGREGLNLRIIKDMNVPLPPLPEQQKIASILSKVDEQIEQTEQIIEKTELLKKGLMQKLFTKGIEHTKFKKTELGEIPEEWDVVKLSKIFKNGPQNGLYKHKSHYGKGHKIVELKDLYKSDFYLDTSDLSLIDLTDKEKLTYELFENDVLINRVSKQIEGVAKVLLAKNIKNIIVFESNMMRASLKESLIIPEFFLHYTSSDFYRLQVTNFAKTGNQSSISQGDLNNIKIFITTIEEQQKIASILSKVDSQIQDNQNYLTRLQELKKGLMQNLLTGKVRVCV